MSESVLEQPDDALLREFAAGDPVAIERMAALIVPQLVRWTQHRYAGQFDRDDLESIVHDIVWRACTPPITFDPTRGAKLTTYLIDLIKRRVVDLARQRTRERALWHELSVRRENTSPASYHRMKDEAETTRLAREEFYEKALPHLTPVEQEILAAMRAGTKAQADYAAILARHGLAIDSAHAVKNAKAQLERRLRNLAAVHGFQADDLLSS
jgi:DNA-directed RNA polymerase specialized sigma24 family protein